MNIDCLMAGVGGQGTILASKLLAQTAMNCGHSVRTSETIGMAQRGGSVVSHVRIGENTVSGIIPMGHADVLIGFEPAEAVRNIGYLKKDGICVVSTRSISPITAALSPQSFDTEQLLRFLRANCKTVIPVDTRRLCTEIGSTRVLNVLLLGAALSAKVFSFTETAMLDTLKQLLPQRLWEINQKALFCQNK